MNRQEGELIREYWSQTNLQRRCIGRSQLCPPDEFVRGPCRGCPRTLGAPEFSKLQEKSHEQVSF